MEGLDDSSDEYGGHKRTRFPFLATARYVVAAVVSVLTVVVVVMVIIVALRPEKVIFSISHQYIEADRLWWVYASDNSMAPAVQTATVGRRLNAGTAAATTTTVPVTINPSLGSTETTTTTTYSAVELVFLWVTLTAANPSGRADITGEKNFTVSVFDRPSSSDGGGGTFRGLREIVTYELQDPFPLNRQTSKTLVKWVRVNDTAVLSYLADTYGGLTRFPAMVRVTAAIFARKQAQVYYCWPVIVGTYSGNDNSAPCRPEEEMDSAFSPAPAPAPTAAAR